MIQAFKTQTVLADFETVATVIVQARRYFLIFHLHMINHVNEKLIYLPVFSKDTRLLLRLTVNFVS